MLLRIGNVHKSFADNEVLRGVDLTVASGEIVALVGENGAGKSTLTRVISGAHRPERGTIAIDDQPVHLTTPQDAMSLGVQVIYQEFRHNLFPHLSVAENLFVREEGRRFGRMLVSRAAMRRAATELLDRLGVNVDVSAAVGSLGVAEQQMIEIAKAMTHRLRLLVLDEPTAALDGPESQRLFAQLRRLRDEGTGIVYITHRLDEVFELADRVVVLRDGQVALTGMAASLRTEDVVGAMVGRPVDDFYPRRDDHRGAVTLSLRGLTRAGAFHDVDLDVRAGEVVGLGGVLGSGRGELMRAVFGLDPVDAGTIEVEGRRLRLRGPASAIANGIGYVTADRQADGLCTGRSVLENISLASLARLAGPLGLVRAGLERERVRELMDRLRVVAPDPDMAVGRLSGGNQQKALFAKWLMLAPRVLLLAEPTRGVDVGAKTEIYRIINELTTSGVAVALVSSDLPELVEMSDRVVVMRGGRVTAELSGASLTQHAVLAHALEGAS
jgi:ABC-type sugar transport system ATPase subunit